MTEVTSGIALAHGTTYYFQVAAINSLGTGTYASVFTATNAENATEPSAPTGLMATTVSATQIDLAWQAPTTTGGADITGYEIQVSENGSDSWTVLHTTLDSGNTYLLARYGLNSRDYPSLPSSCDQ